MCVVCTLSLVSRRKTPQKNNHQNRNARQAFIKAMKKEMTCFIIRCFFENKKKISQKKMKRLFDDDQFFYASCIFCSDTSIST